jgi:hypothetical protein
VSGGARSVVPVRLALWHVRAVESSKGREVLSDG